MEPLLVFDGDCGFCTRVLGWLRVVDRRRIITTRPYQQEGVPESIGLTREQCAAAVRWRGVDGHQAEGAEAINAALATALDTDWPTRLYARTATPQRACYAWVARNRHRLPGITPWCTRHPHDCAAPPRPETPTGR